MQVEAKVVVIGAVGVGKSSITIRYIHNSFNNHLESTLGAVYFQKTLSIDENKVRFEFWDTAGQERYKAIARIYYKDCKVAVVVYDVTQKVSFVALKSWIDELRTNGPSNILIAIVGNKVDLVEDDSQGVPYSEAFGYANSIGAVFKYTSAKENKGIEELFQMIATRLLKKSEEIPGESVGKKGTHLNTGSKKKKSKCC